MARASWKLCSMSGLQTPSASELETSPPRPPDGPSLELESSEPGSESGCEAWGPPPPGAVRPGPEFQGDEILNTDIGATLHVYRKTVEVAVTSAVSSPRLPCPQDEDMDVVVGVVFVVVLADQENAAVPNTQAVFHGTRTLFRAP